MYKTKENEIAAEIDNLERKLHCAIGRAIIYALAEVKVDPDDEADCLKIYDTFRAARDLMSDIKENF